MKILFAEDEKELSAAVVSILKASGYETDAVYNGVDAVMMAGRHSYDCMIFDIMMPGRDGITVLKEVRASGNVTPVIMLTAKGEVEDRIDGLDAGADDYLAKPFAMKELLARIRSLTRRAGSFTPDTLSLGNIELNTETQELKGTSTIRLSAKEAKLLNFLLLNPRKELTVSEIFRRVWSDGDEESEAIVWVYISYLRQKFEAVQSSVVLTGEAGGPFALKA